MVRTFSRWLLLTGVCLTGSLVWSPVMADDASAGTGQAGCQRCRRECRQCFRRQHSRARRVKGGGRRGHVQYEIERQQSTRGDA